MNPRFAMRVVLATTLASSAAAFGWPSESQDDLRQQLQALVASRHAALQVMSVKIEQRDLIGNPGWPDLAKLSFVRDNAKLRFDADYVSGPTDQTATCLLQGLSDGVKIINWRSKFSEADIYSLPLPGKYKGTYDVLPRQAIFEYAYFLPPLVGIPNSLDLDSALQSADTIVEPALGDDGKPIPGVAHLKIIKGIQPPMDVWLDTSKGGMPIRVLQGNADLRAVETTKQGDVEIPTVIIRGTPAWWKAKQDGGAWQPTGDPVSESRIGKREDGSLDLAIGADAAGLLPADIEMVIPEGTRLTHVTG